MPRAYPFKVGDRVRIHRGAFYRLSTTGSTYPINALAAGGAGVITSGPDRDGDFTVLVDGEGTHDVSADCLDVATPSAATATVRVDVRFFVGDVDVTDKVGALVIEGLS